MKRMITIKENVEYGGATPIIRHSACALCLDLAATSPHVRLEFYPNGKLILCKPCAAGIVYAVAAEMKHGIAGKMGNVDRLTKDVLA